ncbi:odorant receptor 131-2-like [Anguilla anguilla]|uniref:odorant receptor 131-2-like n=1 Tax=Anguilla anguilla TaxID=7936 RepID=UPI0015B0CC17|nr:odorant receptor 131-2-like [Anguilla anguilla]XP_035242247.1 odorant receptor 131-2-like [Anguilla anguilla]XP_035242248.1 odorant receptor 131-2-like [Anguilla anguilla]XP_035242249.1 odorant receptor 131-2-like [Anguilla anguilla]XP_035242250.1 odorant receptor 131-2-like [Anguilla anguilla]XP_035242252.1 odorant receptor 131-2-like [Anguilla anguilla]
MDQNSSSEELQLITSDPVVLRIKMAIAQVLVWFFIYIDIFMLFTFFSKQAFRGNARYILFAHTLLVDSIYLLLTELSMLFKYNYLLCPVGSCILLCIVMAIVTRCTPLTITAMCLERYVAICMPLRHADIATPSRTLAVIIVVSAYSSLTPFVDLFILIVTAPPGYFAKLTVCQYKIVIEAQWHSVMRAVWYQVDLAVIVIIILFCFFKIMLAALAASGENKQSASKGRRTLLLHGLQLILCIADMLGPYTEKIALEHNLELYLTIRYFNFVALGIVSRALSSIIYGLRDKKFFLALMYYTTCRFNHNIAA